MKTHLSRRTIGALAGTAVALMLVGAVAWRAALRSAELRDRVAHSHEVLAQLSAVLSDLQDVETGGRGFVITGEEEFLEPYRVALTQLDANVTRLESLVADNLDHAPRLRELKTHIAGRISATREHVGTRREQGFEAARQLVLAGKGKAAMDHARAVVAAMETEERRLLDVRNHEAATAVRRVFGAFVLAGLSTIGLLLAIGVIIHRDLADRKVAEDKLRASEARLRNVFAQANDGIFVISADNQYLDANTRGLELLGYAREELLRLSVADVLAPREVARLAVEPPRMMSGEPHLAEWDHVRKDGTTFPGEVSARRLNDASYLAIVRDLTARKQAESALRESEARLRLSAEAANVGLWDWDLKTNQVFFSREWKRQIGYGDDEISNDFSEWQSRVHPDDLEPALQKAIAFVANPQGRHESEFRFRHKDGSYRWIYTHADVLRDADGKPARMLGCHIDITERKRAEVERRQVFERVSDAFVALDRDWRYTYANAKAAQLFGRRPEELIGKNIWTEFPEGVGQPFHRAYERSLAEQTAITLEEFYPPYDRWFENRIYPSPEGLTIYFTDITERKRAEEALHELSARLLAVQDEERRRLARELHDSTAQKLAALGINLATLGRALPSDNHKAARLLAESELLNDQAAQEIRTLSYLLHPPLLDAIGLAGAVRDYAAGFTKRSQIKVAVEVPGEFGRLQPAAELALFRVVQESLGNVLRHSGGTAVAIRLSRAERTARLEVQDNGSGIPADKLVLIREMRGALGVGIAGMRERLRQLGGELAIESGPNGTTVRATLPLG